MPGREPISWVQPSFTQPLEDPDLHCWVEIQEYDQFVFLNQPIIFWTYELDKTQLAMLRSSRNTHKHCNHPQINQTTASWKRCSGENEHVTPGWRLSDVFHLHVTLLSISLFRHLISPDVHLRGQGCAHPDSSSSQISVIWKTSSCVSLCWLRKINKNGKSTKQNL